MFQSLRFRLTLFNALVMAVALCVSGVAVQFIVSRDLMRLVDEHMLDQFQHLEQAALSTNLVEQASTHAAPNGTNVQVTIFDLTKRSSPSPQTLARPGFKEALTGAKDWRRVKREGREFRQLTAPAIRDGKVVYVVQILSPLDQLDSAIHQLNGVLLHLLPFALILSVLGGAFLTGKSLKPVGEMAKAAEQINATSLSQRLPSNSSDELGRLASVFNRMLGRLESSFENQRRFTADASHELRTPLTALKANTSLALAEGSTSDDMRNALEAADKAADRMSRLVNDLLFLSRSDAGQLEPKLTSLQLEPACQSVIEMLRCQAGNQRVELVCNVAPTLVAFADGHLLERLLANLVANAIRHSKPEGVVRIIGDVVEGAPVVRVQDHGYGIPPEYLPKIFERFYSVDESRSGSGTGLGLAICASIATAIRAEIVVESQLEVGTTFSVVLQRPPA